MSATMIDFTVDKDLVLRDTKGDATPEESAYLRGDGLAEWITILVEAMQDVDAQFRRSKDRVAAAIAKAHAPGATAEDRAALAQLKSDESAWKRKAGVYKKALERRLAEARSLQRDRNVNATNRYKALQTAVRRHRQEMLAEDYEPTEMDEELWRAVDEIEGNPSWRDWSPE